MCPQVTNLSVGAWECHLVLVLIPHRLRSVGLLEDLSVYNLSSTLGEAEIGCCCPIGSAFFFFLVHFSIEEDGTGTADLGWSQNGTCLWKKWARGHEVTIPPTHAGCAEGTLLSSQTGLVLVGAVVIVTPDCSPRPQASCGWVAMAKAGCSVGVLLW